MRKHFDRAFDRMTASEASIAVRLGRVTPLFQPIEALQTGGCRGFEALARLPVEGQLVSPHTFLDTLCADDRLCLFGAILGESIALFKREAQAMRGLYVSINVEVSLIVSADFVDVLHYFLERYDFAGERLVLEILENEDVADFSKLQATLESIRRLGLSIALDDVGSGYASLAKARDLPIDILKLDRSFSRDLEMHPEDLIFVSSMLSITHGLGKRLIVEGIETPEVYDALRILGVELGQGYAIAAPMAATDVAPWLADRVLREPSKTLHCLLGAYASHLTVVEACRVLRCQPLPMSWTETATDHKNCAVGRLFGARNWHDTAFGEAHRLFHVALPLFDKDEAGFVAAAKAFQVTMAEAIAARPAEMRCERVPSPAQPNRDGSLKTRAAKARVATI